LHTTGLQRHFGLLHATALNVTMIVGAGVFITIPLMLTELPRPYALLGWLLEDVGPADADESDLVIIDFTLSVPRSGMEHLIDEETRVGHTALDYCLPAEVLLLLGFVLGSRQLRGDHFRVVQSSDDIPVAAQVRMKKRGRPPGRRTLGFTGPCPV